jgi:flavin reductase (DIM6/NTAB) family NADH-FMN oxidoreductase RutF
MKKSLGPKMPTFVTPVIVIGTYGAEGRPNIMTVAWAGICCSRPPCLAISLRKETLTHGNLVARKAFTANIPSEALVAKADYCGLASGCTTDKFHSADLTPARSALVDAPLVAEFPMSLECRVRHITELGSHTQFVGEILDVKVDESILAGTQTDITRLKPVIFAPENQGYYAVGNHLGQAFSVGATL